MKPILEAFKYLVKYIKMKKHAFCVDGMMQNTMAGRGLTPLVCQCKYGNRKAGVHWYPNLRRSGKTPRLEVPVQNRCYPGADARGFWEAIHCFLAVQDNKLLHAKTGCHAFVPVPDPARWTGFRPAIGLFAGESAACTVCDTPAMVSKPIGTLVPNSVISRAPDLLSTVVDGELVLMSIHLGNYYGVASSARRIWEMLESPVTLEHLLAELGREFEGDSAVMHADVVTFIESLQQQGLVTTR